MSVQDADVIIVGTTANGLAAAITAAEEGLRVTVIERADYPGDSLLSGVVLSEMTPGLNSGLGKQFQQRIKEEYHQRGIKNTTGRSASPHVVQKVLATWLAEFPQITLLTGLQLNIEPGCILLEEGRPAGVILSDRLSRRQTMARGRLLIDATPEGDVLAACGAAYRWGREGTIDDGESFAGPLIQHADGSVEVLGFGGGDDRLQAYGGGICLTNDPKQKVPFRCPEVFQPELYESLIEVVAHERWMGPPLENPRPIDWLVDLVQFPDGICYAQPQWRSWITTDYAGINQVWLDGVWDDRREVAYKIKNYVLGLFYFATTDCRLPEWFRVGVKEWGLVRSVWPEYDHVPPVIEVRGLRRLEGRQSFKLHDGRTDSRHKEVPVHADSLAAIHQPLHVHACATRQPGLAAHDGCVYLDDTSPATVPMDVFLPPSIDSLVVATAVSSTHLGQSMLRPPMSAFALGEAAGALAVISRQSTKTLADLDAAKVQQLLLARGCTLVHVPDVSADHPLHGVVQKAALAGCFADGFAHLDAAMSESEIADWTARLGSQERATKVETRGLFLSQFA